MKKRLKTRHLLPGIKRRNPVARALIERALGGGVVPSRKRYTRKLKHPKRDRPDD